MIEGWQHLHISIAELKYLVADDKQQWADARLIAAAPDLLEALTAIRARISGEWDNPALLKFGPLSDTETDIQIIARTAIRKAEGRL